CWRYVRAAGRLTQSDRERTGSDPRDTAQCQTDDSSGGELPQAQRVLRRVAQLVVVEVREDVEPVAAPGADPLRPLTEHPVVVIRRVPPARSVEAQVHEVRRDRRMGRPVRRLADDESDLPSPQERERLVAEPRRVTRLERVSTPARRDETEEPLRALLVVLHARRELHEHDRGLAPESRQGAVRPLDAFALDPEPLDVRDEPIELHRVDEAVGYGVAPAHERPALGLSVEGIVQIDRVEAHRVIREPTRDRKMARVEPALPVGVLPAGGADPQL